MAHGFMYTSLYTSNLHMLSLTLFTACVSTDAFMDQWRPTMKQYILGHW